MFSKVYSGGVHGMDGYLVSVEADVCDGLPCFEMVGYLANEVREAKERVRTSLRNVGFKLPPKRITINLSPADIRKEGTGFDLPIAIGILACLGYVNPKCLESVLIVGELSLDGQIRAINGALSIASIAEESGFTRCFLPIDNSKEGAVIQGIDVIGVTSIVQIVEYLNNPKILVPERLDMDHLFSQHSNQSVLDFSEMNGQVTMKRAALVAAAGMHNLMFVGPPGASKTMAAKRIPTILPELTLEESIEITKIYSICGLLPKQSPLVLQRPFRSPHHTASTQALTGGGRIPKPGELSLANRGVLFLDELTEFQKNTLEVLRQPLEERKITIARVHGSYEFPAKFMLVAAINPCKCGYYPDRKLCHCSEIEVKRYLGKISRPLLDRIDIIMEAPKITFDEIHFSDKNETSKDMRKRVEQARSIQRDRFQGSGIYYNSEMPEKSIPKYCSLSSENEQFIKEVFERFQFSARAYHKVLKVARTIADLDGKTGIDKTHLSEAINYRRIDKKYWGDQN